MTAKYEELELTNDHNNKTMVVELKAEYFEYIMSQVKSLPNLCENSFNGKHQIAKSKALEEFEARRNQPNSHVTDVYKSNMIQVGFINKMLTLNYQSARPDFVKYSVGGLSCTILTVGKNK